MLKSAKRKYWREYRRRKTAENPVLSSLKTKEYRERVKSEGKEKRFSIAHKKWYLKYPERYKAHRAVFVAKRNGTLVKLPCEECGSLNVQAHHEDYSKPLDVRWLCKKHHNEADMKRKSYQQVAIDEEKVNV